MISMDKKYRTRAKEDSSEPGYPVRILCVDKACPGQEVVGLVKKDDGIEHLYSFNAYGICLCRLYNLIEISPYENLKIDDKVIVWDDGNQLRHKAHFAGISENGKALAFINGVTSWTTHYSGFTKNEWDHCELAND